MMTSDRDDLYRRLLEADAAATDTSVRATAASRTRGALIDAVMPLLTAERERAEARRAAHPETCPQRGNHGSPFRYCPVKGCGWHEGMQR